MEDFFALLYFLQQGVWYNVYDTEEINGKTPKPLCEKKGLYLKGLYYFKVSRLRYFQTSPKPHAYPA